METMRIQRSLSGRFDATQAGVYAPADFVRTQRGFTLIEMMVVIGIMAIMMAIALPAFSDWRERAAAKSAADSLMAHLKQARITAIADNRSVSIVFAAKSYIFDNGGLKQIVVNLSQFSPVISLTSTVSPLTFSSRGTAATANIQVVNPNGKNWIIVVNSVGRVYFQ